MSLAKNKLFQQYGAPQQEREEEEEEADAKDEALAAESFGEAKTSIEATATPSKKDDTATATATAQQPQQLYSPSHGNSNNNDNNARDEENKNSSKNVTQGATTAAATSEWDNVNSTRREETSASASASESPSQRISMPITFREAYTVLRLSPEHKQQWTPYIGEVKRRSAAAPSGVLAWCFSCCCYAIEEGTAEYEERDFLLCLLKVPFDHSDALHRRVLITVYRKILRPKRSEPDPPTTGPMWEKIGFQGSNPATDLRATGLFGLLQMLYLLEEYPFFANAYCKEGLNPLCEFPIMLTSFNFAAISIEALQDESLHGDIGKVKKAAAKERHQQQQTNASSEKKKNAVGSPTDTGAGGLSGCVDLNAQRIDAELQQCLGSVGAPPPIIVGRVVCDFFVASCYEFYRIWKEEESRTIIDFPPIKARLRPYLKKNASSVMRKHCAVIKDRKLFVSGGGSAAGCGGNRGVDMKNLEFTEF